MKKSGLKNKSCCVWFMICPWFSSVWCSGANLSRVRPIKNLDWEWLSLRSNSVILILSTIISFYWTSHHLIKGAIDIQCVSTWKQMDLLDSGWVRWYQNCEFYFYFFYNNQSIPINYPHFPFIHCNPNKRKCSLFTHKIYLFWNSHALKCLYNPHTLKHVDLNLKKKEERSRWNTLWCLSWFFSKKKKRFRKTRRFYEADQGKKKSPFVGTLDFIQAIKHW